MAIEGTNYTILQFTDNRFGDDVKLHMIRNIKKMFKNNFGSVKLESLLTHLTTLFDQHSSILDTELLVSTGFSLIDYVGRIDVGMDDKLLCQLELILLELKKRDDKVTNTLSDCIWRRFQKLNIVRPQFLISVAEISKTIFERIILSFVENPGAMDYYIKICSESPRLFQIGTSVLNEILIKCEGHDQILKLITSFVNGVMTVCEKEQKNFLALYPNDCCRIVSLLMISPDIYSTGADKSIGIDAVLNLVLNAYNSNRKKTLLLLSHYLDWLLPFKIYLMEKNGERL